MSKPISSLLAVVALGAAGLWLVDAPADAQLPQSPSVPGLGTPAIPQTQLPGAAPGAVNGAVENTLRRGTGVVDRTVQSLDAAADQSTRALRNLREDSLRQLRRAHPDLIDVDDRGQAVARGEIIAMAPTDAILAVAQAAGFTIIERDADDVLGLSMVTLRAPAGLSSRDAMDALRAINPDGAYEFNHLYLGAGDTGAKAPMQTFQTRGEGGGGARIGLIDSGVDAAHPALAGLVIRQRGFAAPEALADTHGTAVGSLLAGQTSTFRGAAPGARLFVADVYGGRPNGGGAAQIVAALQWLAAERTPVVNVSLVGPPNRALEAAIRAMIARGHVIVAAVGNDGPSAPPLYPASYPGVIGVTGVDPRDRALPEAGRGQQVDFAAPGSDMAAAAPGGAYVRVRGTSYAAPIVAGLIAARLSSADPANAQRAQAGLAAAATDLGARGVDPVFGAGRVGRDVRVAPNVLIAARR